MIDHTECLRCALMDFGQQATVGGVEVPTGIVFNRAPAVADPYMSDTAHDGPSCNVLREDLEAIGQWPLPSDTKLVTEGKTYLILHPDDDRGDVTLLLAET